MIMNKLNLFTYHFPYGNQETFLETEIEYLSNEFDKIYIYPREYTSHRKRVLPPNVDVVLLKNIKPKLSFGAVANYIQDIFREKGKRQFAYLIHLLSYLDYYFYNYEYYQTNKVFFQNKKDEFFYSYWFLDRLLFLSLMKKNQIITKLYARCHGGDLYDERNGGAIPGRMTNSIYCDRIIPISLHGKNYLEKRIKYKDKINFSRLGVEDIGLNSNINDSLFIIVSCSNVIPIKRCELIADFVSKLSIEVSCKWYHFGDGENFDKLINKVQDSNINFEFLGRLPNQDVINFYKKNSVSLFVNFSLFEGIPVSIMEAMSFGIPILATDVGGTSEIVVDGGVLLDKNFEIDKAVDSAKKIINNDDFRIMAKKDFNNLVNAKNNYTEFIKLFKE